MRVGDRREGPCGSETKGDTPFFAWLRESLKRELHASPAVSRLVSCRLDQHGATDCGLEWTRLAWRHVLVCVCVCIFSLVLECCFLSHDALAPTAGALWNFVCFLSLLIDVFVCASSRSHFVVASVLVFVRAFEACGSRAGRRPNLKIWFMYPESFGGQRKPSRDRQWSRRVCVRRIVLALPLAVTVLVC